MKEREIIERLEKLTGPSEETDAQIVAFLNNATVKRYPPTDDFGPKNRWQFWSLDGKHFLGSESKYPVPALTKSLDSIVALIESKLPGAEWFSTNNKLHSDTPYAQIVIDGPRGYTGHEGGTDSQSPAIALCIALLKALEDGKP